MPFRITNVTVAQSVSLADANTEKKISELAYTPVWVYAGPNKVPGQGTFSLDSTTGYKTVNEVDANGIHIKSWINTLATMVAGSGPLNLNFNVYITAVDGEGGNAFTISNLSVITDNGNHTFTLAGGDFLSGATVAEGQKIYMSYFTLPKP